MEDNFRLPAAPALKRSDSMKSKKSVHFDEEEPQVVYIERKERPQIAEPGESDLDTALAWLGQIDVPHAVSNDDIPSQDESLEEPERLPDEEEPAAIETVEKDLPHDDTSTTSTNTSPRNDCIPSCVWTTTTTRSPRNRLLWIVLILCVAFVVVLAVVLSQMLSTQPSSTAALSPAPKEAVTTDPQTELATTSPTMTLSPTTLSTTLSPTPAPTLRLEDHLLSILTPFLPSSSVSLLTQGGTPPWNAFHFLLEQDDETYLRSLSDDKLRQRYALAVLYYQCRGQLWSNKHLWMEPGVDECLWEQQLAQPCDTDGILTTLDLSENAVENILPRDLVLLSHLEHISFYGNDLVGNFPGDWLMGLTSLTHLDISYNRIGGSIPEGVVNLQLQYLDASSNSLRGPLPEALGTQWPNLKQLFLMDNQIQGDLPTSLGLLTELRQLYAQNNALTGRLPSELGHLTRLERLYLEENDLTGTVPSEWSQMESLFDVHLYDNELSGTVPNGICQLQTTGVLFSFEVDCLEVTCDCCDCSSQ